MSAKLQIYAKIAVSVSQKRQNHIKYVCGRVRAGLMTPLHRGTQLGLRNCKMRVLKEKYEIFFRF